MLPRDRTSAREWAFAAPSGPKSTTNRPVGGVQPVPQGDRTQAYEHVPLLVAGIGGDEKTEVGIGQHLCIDGGGGGDEFLVASAVRVATVDRRSGPAEFQCFHVDEGSSSVPLRW